MNDHQPSRLYQLILLALQFLTYTTCCEYLRLQKDYVIIAKKFISEIFYYPYQHSSHNHVLGKTNSKCMQIQAFWKTITETFLFNLLIKTLSKTIHVVTKWRKHKYKLSVLVISIYTYSNESSYIDVTLTDWESQQHQFSYTMHTDTKGVCWHGHWHAIHPFSNCWF